MQLIFGAKRDRFSCEYAYTCGISNPSFTPDQSDKRSTLLISVLSSPMCIIHNTHRHQKELFLLDPFLPSSLRRTCCLPCILFILISYEYGRRKTFTSYLCCLLLNICWLWYGNREREREREFSEQSFFRRRFMFLYISREALAFGYTNKLVYFSYMKRMSFGFVRYACKLKVTM